MLSAFADALQCLYVHIYYKYNVFMLSKLHLTVYERLVFDFLLMYLSRTFINSSLIYMQIECKIKKQLKSKNM